MLFRANFIIVIVKSCSRVNNPRLFWKQGERWRKWCTFRGDVSRFCHAEYFCLLGTISIDACCTGLLHLLHCEGNEVFYLSWHSVVCEDYAPWSSDVKMRAWFMTRNPTHVTWVSRDFARFLGQAPPLSPILAYAIQGYSLFTLWKARFPSRMDSELIVEWIDYSVVFSCLFQTHYHTSKDHFWIKHYSITANTLSDAICTIPCTVDFCHYHLPFLYQYLIIQNLHLSLFASLEWRARSHKDEHVPGL